MQYNKCDEQIIARIKQLRKVLGLTQSQLGGILGVSQGAMSRIENGTQSLEACGLAVLVEIYEININWLLAGHGQMKLKDSVQCSSQESAKTLLAELNEWLVEEEEEEPDIWSWFRIQLGMSFPSFKTWLKKRDQTNSKTGNRRAA